MLYEDVACVVPPQRFHAVANGIDVAGVVEGTASDERETNEHVPVILFLSNLMEEKGPLDLLEASERLAKDGVAHTVVFVGPPVGEAVMEALTRAQQADGKRVAVLGPRYGSAKDSVLAEADIFAFPTHDDAQPLVVMEAMGHRLAIIASSEGSIPEMLCDGAGLIFAPCDVAQLTRHLRLLIEDRELRSQLGQLARERYLQTFTCDAFEARFVEALVTIMSGTRIDEKENAASCSV